MTETDRKAFGIRLLQLMEKKGMKSYVPLQTELGVTEAAVSAWVSGKHWPKIETVHRMAEYFGVTMDYLVFGKEEKHDD